MEFIVYNRGYYRSLPNFTGNSGAKQVVKTSEILPPKLLKQ